ncbi:MAG: carboxypeptidase regulatory-like domain-containing protein [Holophagales bacterium]|nr:MAG: carboxypeptidase regulatory-like domain-containing protein [Holophagales bacterium]
MSTNRSVVALCLAWMALAGGARADQAPDPGRLAGRVLDSAAPLPAVQVYAYQLVDRTLRLATTQGDGEFFFDALPAGLYKVIAFKRGFAPAVLMLTRASRQAAQWVELQLVASPEEGGDGDADFWALREQVPPDVLREIELADGTDAAKAASSQTATQQQFLAQMTAETGVTQLLGGTDAAFAGGEMRLQGTMLGMRLSVDGDYRQLGSERFDAGSAGASGKTTSLALRLLGSQTSELDLRSRVDRLTTRVGGHEVPVDFAQHGVRWSRAFGPATESAILAQYTEESGLHAKGLIEPAAIPLASRSFRLEGTYSRELGDLGELHAAVRYRERNSEYGDETSPLLAASQRQFEAFGGGDLKLDPRVGLSYGLLGGLRAGDVALTPRAGADLGLGPNWKGRVLVSKRFDLGGDGNAWLEEFIPLLLGQDDPCDAAGLTCYELELRRGDSATDPGSLKLALSGAQREFDRTVRLYFSDDFFDQVDSLFLVPGDRLPEIKVVLSRKLGDRVFAKLESTAASGGGGSYVAADRQPYRNSVAYLVTSLDTRFAASSTAVIVAFQRLQQDLEPMLGPIVATVAQLDLERLELTVTQDLNVFFDLPASWAMRVNMELSRGTTSYLEDLPSDSVRRRLTTGVSVRF